MEGGGEGDRGPVVLDDEEDETTMLPQDAYAPVQTWKDATIMSIPEIREEIELIKKEISEIEDQIFDEEEDDDYEVVVPHIPPHCVPIRADVRSFDWQALSRQVQFDVIIMDPPWQLAGSAPTRGVALGYKQLHNKDIEKIPVPLLQKNGFLFIWVINARYAFALDLMEKWGYRFVDDIAWVKATVNRRMAKGHGFYLQHAKETCLVGLKGEDPPNMQGNRCSDVIFSERRGQSQKPEEIYHIIESLVPSGRYLEIFARRNNLRDYWVSVGLEL
jgi:mRNA (2'-O-methyladenosine-N6-)-methyltransferase